MRITIVSFALLALAACAGARSPTGLGQLRTACPASKAWNGTTCVDWGPGESMVGMAEALLEAGKIDQAIGSFEVAVNAQPHSYPVHVLVFERLGVAYSYKEDEEQAKQAFTRLLLLDPAHLLSYNLSPRATLKFEAAREKLQGKPPPTLDVNWPPGNDVGKPIRVGVEVVADPAKMLRAATLFVREDSAGPTFAADVTLGEPGTRAEIVIPALGGKSAKTLDLHLVARDEHGSEVFLWASAAQPRRLQVDYTPPIPLRKKWWFWAGIGLGVATAGVTTVLIVTRDPPDFLGGPFTGE